MEKLRLRKSARKDSMRLEKLVHDYNLSLVPPADGFGDEEETVCKKITDEEGNIIGGCVAYVSPWGCLYVDTIWVDEKYRRQELGSNLLQAVEEVGKNRGCYLCCLDTGDFQARPFYIKHGYTVFATTKHGSDGFEDYSLFKRFDKPQAKRPHKPIKHEIADGSEEDGEYIDEKLEEYNRPFLKPKHEYIKINRKLVDENGNVVAAIMAGVTEIDDGIIWKIWVDEKCRDKGLGTLLLKHYEKKAKEKGATRFIAEEIYDWNVDFFLKNGYKAAGVLPDLPKGHGCYIVEKKF
ncbi:MAG: GNAT family N-acetyltransferase [Clostridia bacterium]|nr:GNAT family N-acetyltransferase [Clostridia bacterium]